MSAAPDQSELYDSALLGILQHVGNIRDFLRLYFGFLYRKTDFYRILTGPTDKLGFPPGVAERMVQQSFRMFEKLAEEDRGRALSELQRRQESSRVPAALQELEVCTEPREEEEEKEEEEKEEEEVEVENSCSGGEVSASAASDPPAPSHRERGGAAGGGAAGGGGAAAGGGGGADTAAAAAAAGGAPTPGPSTADSYNGAVRENYSWSQDFTDVEVRVFVPKSVVKGRQVGVALQCGGIRVSVRDGGGGEEKTLMEGEFTHKINTENSLWSLEPGDCVVLSLNKTSEVWWNAVLRGEQEIDINQINRERSMATVDEEEHAVLDRLTFDYHQKLQGKPQSHEMKVHDMLKKGWDAEGSPFRGQKFDPSMFDIPPSAVQF